MSQNLPWWGTRKTVSTRMHLELANMTALFNKERPVHVLNPSSWDVSFYVETVSIALDLDNILLPFWMISAKMLPDPEAGVCRYPPQETYSFKILYSGNYPATAPIVTMVSHEIQSVAQHHFSQGQLCLHTHDGSRTTGWDPAKSTAATYGLWTLKWIRAWVNYGQTGVWPVAN